MTAIIAMLRGVNVGGHHIIKMDGLRAVCESLKLRDPRTLGQSGNVIFNTDERDLVLLAKRLEDRIEQSFGFRPDAMLRTISELSSVIRRNPFRARRDINPSKLLVAFLASDPGSEARDKVHAIETHPEELWIDGRELYIYFPHGQGRSKLPWEVIQKALKVSWTGRNWNTVTKLLEIAQSLETSAPRGRIRRNTNCA